MRNLPPRRKGLLLSPKQQNRSPGKMATRAMEMKRGRPKKKRRRNRKSPEARQQRKRQRDQGPRRARPELHSSSQVRRPWLNLWVLRCKLFVRKSNFFVCCDISCARARATHCCSTTFLLTLCAARFTLWCMFLCWCTTFCARPRAKMDVKQMVLVVLRATRISKTVYEKNQELMGIFTPKHKC